MQQKEGIILKAVKYQENSKIVTLITPEGIDSLFFRGALTIKNKTFAYSQELIKLNYTYTARDEESLKIFTGGEILYNYVGLRSDLRRLSNALIMIEMAATLAPHIEKTELFYQFFDEIFLMLESSEFVDYLLIIFKLKALYLLGVGPRFTHCVTCGNRYNLVGFAFSVGGMQCRRCASSDDIIIKGDVITISKFLYLKKMPELTNDVLKTLPPVTKELITFVDSYYDYYLGYRSRAERVINKINRRN